MRIKLGHPLLLRYIAEVCCKQDEAPLVPNCLQAVTHITTDSREVMPGDLFVALDIGNEDGHKYISDAVAQGASSVLLHRNSISYNHVCLIQCTDTMEALCNLAFTYADSIPHKTVAITGSVGKTTTRRFISSVLSQKFHVHESPNNFNNLLGCCLTLLSMSPETDILVAECGMSARGEIRALSRLIRPDISVITNIGISHLASLGTQEEICAAKLEILEGMNGGTLLCEGSDTYLRCYAPRSTVFVSATDSTASYCCYNIAKDITGMSFRLKTPEDLIFPLHIPAFGLHNLSCATFAASIACTLGLSHDELRIGLANYTPEYMRQNICELNGITLIFDAYNACPASMKAACDTLCDLAVKTGGKKVAVIGDMSELGEMTEQSHAEIGKYFAQKGIDSIIAWGNYSTLYQKGVADEKTSECAFRMFPLNEEILNISDYISGQLAPKDVLLIKGSRFMKMERLLPTLKSINRKNS